MTNPAVSPVSVQLSVAGIQTGSSPCSVLGPDLPEEHPARQLWLTLFRTLLQDADPLSPRGFLAARAASLLVLARKLEARLLSTLDDSHRPMPPAAAFAQCARLRQEAAEMIETLREESDPDTAETLRPDPEVPVSRDIPGSNPAHTTDASAAPQTETRASDCPPDGPQNPKLTPPVVSRKTRQTAACSLEKLPDTVKADVEHRLRWARAQREADLLLPKNRPTAEKLIQEAARQVLLKDWPPPNLQVPDAPAVP